MKAAAPLPAAGRRLVAAARRVFGAAAPYLALAAAWELFARAVARPILAPDVVSVLRALAALLQSGELLDAVGWSLSALALGFSGGSLAGVALGVLTGGLPLLNRALSPYLHALYATPLVALVPVVVLWFGIGLAARATFVGVWVVFPVLINTHAGMQAAEARLTEVARSFGATRWQLWWHVLLPYTAPFLFAGLLLASGRALVGLILAETFLQSGGLGALLATYGASYSTDYVFAVIAVLPLMHWSLVGLVKAAERRVLRWHPANPASGA